MRHHGAYRVCHIYSVYWCLPRLVIPYNRENTSDVVLNSRSNSLKLYSSSWCFRGRVVLNFFIFIILIMIYFVINIEFIFAFPTNSTLLWNLWVNISDAASELISFPTRIYYLYSYIYLLCIITKAS